MEDCLFAKCDAEDKAFALFCGVIGGVIDIFFVGEPTKSIGGKMADAFVDDCIVKFSNLGLTKRLQGGKTLAPTNDPVEAIGRLEREYKVNYDQRYTSDTGGQVELGTKNHHLKSLGHSPDIVGLFFSILDQFCHTAHFIDNGEIVAIQTEEMPDNLTLLGNSVPAKVFCGFVNWFGHLMSDVGGSTTAAGRGSGIPLPFYNLLTLCDFGAFTAEKKTVAQVASDIFVKGYDVRAGIAMSIPVLLTEMMIKFYWFIKRKFFLKLPLKDCFPSIMHGDLRGMLLIADGTLCVIDGADAVLRSKGDIVAFAMRFNIVAWSRFTKLVFREICIRNRWGLAYLEMEFEMIDAALEQHLRKLHAIDIQKLEEELHRERELNQKLYLMQSEQDIAMTLYDTITAYDLDLPFHDHTSFNQFMNSDEELIF